MRRVTLVPLPLSEYAEDVERLVVEYAADNVRAGEWRPGEALQESRKEIENLLPEGQRTAGFRFCKGLDENGRRIGWVCAGPVPPGLEFPDAEWLYEIRVDESVRRQGYGRALLRAVEELLLRDGVKELRFNVFAWNAAARALYETSGYETVREWKRELWMRKRLLP